jgi:hypothetical protein
MLPDESSRGIAVRQAAVCFLPLLDGIAFIAALRKKGTFRFSSLL